VLEEEGQRERERERVATFLTEQFILTCENCNPSHLACYAAKTYSTTSRSGVSGTEKSGCKEKPEQNYKYVSEILRELFAAFT
jgi:hypothetical protein